MKAFRLHQEAVKEVKAAQESVRRAQGDLVAAEKIETDSYDKLMAVIRELSVSA